MWAAHGTLTKFDLFGRQLVTYTVYQIIFLVLLFGSDNETEAIEKVKKAEYTSNLEDSPKRHQQHPVRLIEERLAELNIFY